VNKIDTNHFKGNVTNWPIPKHAKHSAKHAKQQDVTDFKGSLFCIKNKNFPTYGVIIVNDRLGNLLIPSEVRLIIRYARKMSKRTLIIHLF